MLPDVDSLALFVRTAELGSLTKAADVCCIGVAAASRRIAILEHKFNAPLFKRTHRGVELTPAGKALFDPAKTVLVQLSQIQSNMADYSSGRKGVLKILANTSAVTQFLPADVARFSESNPDVRLIVEEGWSSNIVNSLLASEVDAGIVVEGVSTNGLTCFPYRTDRLAVIAPKNHAIMALEEISFSDVLDYDFIGLEGSASLMLLLTDEALRAQKPLRTRVQVRSFEAVSRMVQAGLGIGILPEQVAMDFHEGLGLAVRALKDPWALRQMLVCIKQGQTVGASLQRLLDTLCPANPTPDTN